MDTQAKAKYLAEHPVPAARRAEIKAAYEKTQAELAKTCRRVPTPQVLETNWDGDHFDRGRALMALRNQRSVVIPCHIIWIGDRHVGINLREDAETKEKMADNEMDYLDFLQEEAGLARSRFAAPEEKIEVFTLISTEKFGDWEPDTDALWFKPVQKHMDSVTGTLDIRAEGTSDKVRFWVDQAIVEEVYNPESGTTTPLGYKLTPGQFEQAMDLLDPLVDLFLEFRAGNGAPKEAYTRTDLGEPQTATPITCDDELKELETLNAEAEEYCKKPIITSTQADEFLNPGEKKKEGRLYMIDSVVSNVRDKIKAIRAEGSPVDDDTMAEIENMHQTLQYYKDKSKGWTK